MAYCEYCGVHLRAGASTCEACGAPRRSPEPQASARSGGGFAAEATSGGRSAAAAGAFCVGPYDEPDRYHLQQRRSSGGEGEIWRASVEVDGVPLPVAVKVINAANSDLLEEWSRRWRQQAEILRTLDHPGLVKVRETFEGPEVHPCGSAAADSRSLFLVMNWVEGESLVEWVARRPSRQLRDSLPIIARLAAAVDYLHSGASTGRPVLHRDIKPANVLIDGSNVRLVDFGFARLASGESMTIAGTPSYMAPEVIRGAVHDAAADRYGLGATAYYALTGTAPLLGDVVGMRARLRRVPGMEGRPELADHVLAMLDPDPARRPASARQWAQVLFDSVAGPPQRGYGGADGGRDARPPAWAAPGRREPEPARAAPGRTSGAQSSGTQWRWPLAALVAVAILAAAGVGVAIAAGWLGGDKDQRAKTPVVPTPTVTKTKVVERPRVVEKTKVVEKPKTVVRTVTPTPIATTPTPRSAVSPQAAPTEAVLVQVAAVDGQRACAVGYDGTILSTSDGGREWQSQASDVDVKLHGVAFADESRGVAVGEDGVVLTTSDGGASWSLGKSATANGLFGVALADATTGLAVGEEGTIVATADGGATWWAQDSGVTVFLSGVTFRDDARAVVVGDRGTILTTDDGGVSWVSPASPTENWLCAVSFADQERGWAVGKAGTIVATPDGGASWQLQSSPTSADLYGVSFSDADHGWAVGMNGTVVVTADGGSTWDVLSSGTSSNLWGVSAADSGRVWAVGTGGTVLLGDTEAQ